jgi:hypothetical protein
MGGPPKNAPKSLVAEIQSEPVKYWPEAKRVKVRYGPFRIPPTSEKNVQSEILNVQGMSTTFTPNAKKPCEDCTLLTVEADLEYADGKPAANSNGVSISYQTNSIASDPVLRLGSITPFS